MFGGAKDVDADALEEAAVGVEDEDEGDLEWLDEEVYAVEEEVADDDEEEDEAEELLLALPLPYSFTSGFE